MCTAQGPRYPPAPTTPSASETIELSLDRGYYTIRFAFGLWLRRAQPPACAAVALSEIDRLTRTAPLHIELGGTSTRGANMRNAKRAVRIAARVVHRTGILGLCSVWAHSLLIRHSGAGKETSFGKAERAAIFLYRWAKRIGNAASMRPDARAAGRGHAGS